MVAPFAGAWIEIKSKLQIKQRAKVAPFAGAWIEMPDEGIGGQFNESLPSRERGLKFCFRYKTGTGKVSLPSRERGLKSS